MTLRTTFLEISKYWNLLEYRFREILQFWSCKSHIEFLGAPCDADSVYSKNIAFDQEMRNLRWGSGGGNDYVVTNRPKQS